MPDAAMCMFRILLVKLTYCRLLYLEFYEILISLQIKIQSFCYK